MKPAAQPRRKRPAPAVVTRPRVWEIAISTSWEAEDATAELMQRITSTTASTYHDLITGRVRASVHVLRLPASRADLLRHLRDGLNHIRACGLDPTPGRITIRHLPATNWAESWKKHFPPLQIGPALLIKPEWIRQRPRAGQHLVTLDPGLSFGTGHHPTTRFCLEELVQARPGTLEKSMLDIGSGSGLLAIAAAKLGYRPVRAFDLDPVAVKVARCNARRNGVGRRIRFVQADLREMGEGLGTHSVVCANLQADLLAGEARSIEQAVAPGGRLVLAGILRHELAAILSTYEGLQLRRRRVRHGKEWSSVSLVKGCSGNRRSL